MMLFSNCLKRIVTTALFLGACLVGGIVGAQDSATSNSGDSKIRNIDGVAAVVNTGYVTRKEIDDRIAQLQKQGAKLPEGATLRQTVLERLIIDKIQ